MSGLFTLQKLTAGYEGKAVIRDIALEIQPGEFCAILGLNGSGKTTLFKAACGLLPILEGRCLVDGLDCTRLNEHKRARYISYIPQRHSLMKGFTVLDVVLMGCNPYLGLFDSPSREDREQAEDILSRMEINTLSDKDFSHLSEGQKQLVVLARALVQHVPVMLMDEPDSALDFLNRHQMLNRIRSLIHKEGKAGMITLHDPNFALAYCDRLMLLQNGKIVAELDQNGMSKQTIQDFLSIVYGNIKVIEQCGRYMVFME